MRRNRMVVLALSIAACHHPAASQVCQPASSWMSPVVSCASSEETDADEFDPEPSQGADEEAEADSEPPPEHPVATRSEPVEAIPTGPASDDPASSSFKARVVGDVIEVSEAIEFATRSHRLLARSKSVLDDVSWVLRRNPGILKVRIEGHTDSKSSRRANRILSIKRAKAVRRYLIKTGVAARRLVAKGFGEASPIADNSTEEGRRQNRRVVFKIVKQK